jgi:membrane associated rhomboid family serine protease
LPDRRNTGASLLATLSTLLMLATFHNLTHLENSIAGRVLLPDLIALGKAQAGLIQGGEWWRIITALTLHADWTHLAGNLTIGGIFIFFLCREVGTGVAWLTILAAGIIGNATNAWVQQPSHSSVGASTAVFGAVGILAAIGMVQYRKSRRQRWQMPVAAAIALLGILGTEGNNTDIGAHLFGFGSGIGLGLGLALTTERYGLPGVNLNILAALTSIATVSFAWWLALTAAGGNTTLMLP